MRQRMFLRIGLILGCAFNIAYAMETKPEIEARQVCCPSKLCLIFLNLDNNRSKILRKADPETEELIDAIIRNNKKSVKKFLHDEPILTAGDCILAFYYANRHKRFELEELLAADLLVQNILLADRDVGLGMLLTLSLQYHLSKIFDVITSLDQERLQHIPTFCYNNALLFAAEHGLDKYAAKLLDHAYINSRLSIEVLFDVRFLSIGKSYHTKVKELLFAKCIETNRF